MNKGRRTPLTLGHANPKLNPGRKNSSDSDSHKVAASILDKLPTIDLTDDNEKQKDKTNGSGPHKNGTSAKNGNGTATAEKSVAAVTPTQKEVSKKEGPVKEVAIKESPRHKEIRETRDKEVLPEAKSNEKKEEALADAPRESPRQKEIRELREKEVLLEAKQQEQKEIAEAVAVLKDQEETGKLSQTIKSGSDKPVDAPRESPRQKEIREAREKEVLAEAKLQEQKEIADALSALKALEETAKVTPPTVTVTPATPEVKSAESPSSKKRGSTSATPVKESPGTSTPKRPSVVDPTNSLLQQSELHGFDDMESLRMDTDGFEDSPMPKSAKAHGKTLKFSQSPALNRARVSPFRRSTDTNASTAVNLSTVSELSTEAANSPAVVDASGAIPTEQSYGSYRHISGRKSMRPLRELTLQHTMRESYRRIKTDLDDSISSVNATMGSEINDNSFRTPMIAVKGRKRSAFGGSEPDLTTAVESPKKARLDFSGFLGIMASPVTLLRNKFSRTSLLCSTPHSKKLLVDAAEVELDEQDESADVDVQMVEVDLNGSDVNKTDVEAVVAASSAVQLDDSLDVVPVASGEIVIETEQLKSVDDIKDKIDEEVARQDDEAAAVVSVGEPKKGRCSIM